MGVIAIVGPTASSKSRLAIEIARRLQGEIVTVDSMQVYRGLDIGTAKPTPQERRAISHHLVDVADPADSFTVAEHQRLGVAAVDNIIDKGNLPLVVGGSGLHFRALVDPLDFPPSNGAVRGDVESLAPAAAVAELLAADSQAGKVVDLANPRRVARALEIFRLTGATPSARAATIAAAAVRNYQPRVPLLALGMDPGEQLAERVAARFDAMLELGLLDEVAGLAPRLGVTASQGVGYKELLPVVRGEVELAVGRDNAIKATKALAKRQRTFFRRDPRIQWIPWHDDPGKILDHALNAATRTIEEATWIS